LIVEAWLVCSLLVIFGAEFHKLSQVHCWGNLMTVMSDLVDHIYLIWIHPHGLVLINPTFNGLAQRFCELRGAIKAFVQLILTMSHMCYPVIWTLRGTFNVCRSIHTPSLCDFREHSIHLKFKTIQFFVHLSLLFHSLALIHRLS